MKLIEQYITADELQQSVDDDNLVYWLTEVKAFTPELKQHVKALHVEVLSQEKMALYEDELELLAQSHRHDEGLVRTVVIYADEQPVCFARVVVSDDIREKQFKDFDELKNKPLGETLFFNSPDAYRNNFQFFRVGAAEQFTSALPTNLQDQFYTYGRSSIFNNDNGQVLVTELFSKHIPQLT